MSNRDVALDVVRKSPRVARLLATAIVVAARVELNLRVSQSEADAMAREYLPTEAVKEIHRNRRRREFQLLPGDYRDLGGKSRTILGGMARGVDRELGGQGTGIGAWFGRLRIRVRTWNAANKIATDLHDRAAQHERARTDSARHTSDLDDLVEELTRQNDDGLQCLELRQEYAVKLRELGLTTKKCEEAIGTLDAIINYHLALLVAETCRT